MVWHDLWTVINEKTLVNKIVGDTRQLADIKLEYNDMQSGKQI